jgi:hypothetical protein
MDACTLERLLRVADQLSVISALRTAEVSGKTLKVDPHTPIEKVIELAKSGVAVLNHPQRVGDNVIKFAILENPRKLFKWRETPLRPVRKDLIKSLQENGWTEPIIFASTLGAGGGQILDGNHRLIAAIKLKMDRVPVYIKLFRGNKPTMPLQYETDLVNQQEYKMLELENQGSDRVPDIPEQWFTTR